MGESEWMKGYHTGRTRGIKQGIALATKALKEVLTENEIKLNETEYYLVLEELKHELSTEREATDLD